MTIAQNKTVQRLESNGYYNTTVSGDCVITFKGPSYDKSKAVVDADGTFLVYAI